MNNLSGGYIMVDLSSPNKVKQLEKAAALNKPLLVYYQDGTTEWGKVTVTYETVDDVQVPTYHITTANGFVTVEADGDTAARPLIVEGEGYAETITGVTIVYNKWSLCGTHLMIVLAGSIADTSVISDGLAISYYKIPSFVSDKIVPVFASIIEIKSISAYADNWSTQNIPVRLEKLSDGRVRISKTSGAITLTADRSFRIQFDLLIDNE